MLRILLFVIDLQDAYKKLIIILKVQYIYIIFQRYKVKKKSQNSRNQGFFTIFAWWQKDPDPYLWPTDPDPIQEAQKHTHPQYW